MNRAEGRNRSETKDLDDRIRALDKELFDAERLPDRSLLFNVEAYAWAIFSRLRAEIFERRLEMPRSDSDVFGVLQRAGIFDVAESRKLRQFCEARLLASRDLSKIDVDGIRSMILDRGWTREICSRFQRIGS